MAAPKLTLSGDAIAYLAEHGRAVTVRSSPRHGCCGGTVAVPIAEVGAPVSTADYEVFESHGISVYLAADLASAARDQVAIGVEGFGPWRMLAVFGLDASM